MESNDPLFDGLIREALQEPGEPGYELTAKVRQLIEKGEIPMKRTNRTPVKTLLIAAAILVLASATAFAAVQLLRPADEIAELLGDEAAADAFRSENAVFIDQKEQSGDYEITLMGIAPVDELDGFGLDNAQNQTYAVIAVSKVDGLAMPEIDSAEYVPLYPLPLVKGVMPWQMGALNTTANTVLDGVLYILAGCDDLEIFADRGVYLGISDRMFYSQDTFIYHEDTGVIARNEGYGGVNVLFELPLDVGKADYQQAELLLYGEPSPSPTEIEPSLEPPIDPSGGDVQPEWSFEELLALHRESYGSMSIEQLSELYRYIYDIPLEECVLIEDSVKTSSPNAEGYISYEYEGDGFSTSRTSLYSIYANSPVGELIKSGAGTNRDGFIIDVYIVSANGDVTFMLYSWEP
ncbi:MAG: hypothetical protein FWG31_09855 [Oscillospiraceae bacterium]|nr:hypothetical protein [Oscillospiraceae bacterium]